MSIFFPKIKLINFSFIFIISAALVYWTLELVKYDKKEGKETEVTAHSFL